MNTAQAIEQLDKDYAERRAKLAALQAEAEQQAEQLAMTEESAKEQKERSLAQLAAQWALAETMMGLQREMSETREVIDQMNRKISEAEACYQTARELQQRAMSRTRGALSLCGRVHVDHAAAFDSTDQQTSAANAAGFDLVAGLRIRPVGMDWNEAKQRGFVTGEYVGSAAQQVIYQGMRSAGRKAAA